MIHLRELRIEAPPGDPGFPFDLPALHELGALSFTSPVTILVGENGAGKSTLIEALAWAAESIAAGAEALDRDRTLTHVRPLGSALRLVWNRRTRRGFFLRAEDFFGYVQRTRASLAEARAAVARIRAENPELPEHELARISGPHLATIRDVVARYGENMDARSHGEQFLAFFQERLVPGGLYLLDEPEAPLSPTRQLALLSILKQAVEERDAQFVLATHSPLLMAYPGATLLSLDERPARHVEWEQLEHVALVRDFLNRPDAFLRHL